MPIKSRIFAPAMVVAGLGAALLLAPVTAAQPECVSTGPTTTQCTTGGSNQIITSPPLVRSNNYGWGILGGFGGGIIIGG
ncbi:hypothetical protein BH09ACT7_BH09ACT7_33610 [soil metagenome]